MLHIEYRPVTAGLEVYTYDAETPPVCIIERHFGGTVFYWSAETGWETTEQTIPMRQSGDLWVYDWADATDGETYIVSCRIDGDSDYLEKADQVKYEALVYYIDYTDVDSEMVDLDNCIPQKIVDAGTEVAWVKTQIRNAQRFINAQISSYATLPYESQDAVPDIIKDLALLVTCYRILRPIYVKEDPSVSDWVDNYKRDADAILKGLRDGSILLDSTDAPAIQSSTSDVEREFSQTTRDSEGNILETGSMEGW